MFTENKPGKFFQKGKQCNVKPRLMTKFSLK